MLTSLLACCALALVPPALGPHAVEKSYMKMDLPSGPGSHRVTIYYPKDLENGPYPVVSFAHGMIAGGPTGRWVYRDIMADIASRGFIIVAPESCLLAYCFNFWRDQLAVITASRNASNHPVFRHVDTSAVGIFGHSMGGDATEQSAGKEGYNITAAVAIHPVSTERWGREIKVPTWFTTGSVDVQAPPATVRAAYEATPGHAWFSELRGGNHYEPCDFGKRRMNPFIGVFFECHVKRNSTACDFFKTNLCGAYNYTECTSK